MKNLYAPLSIAGLMVFPIDAFSQSDENIEVIQTMADVEIALSDADLARPDDKKSIVLGGTNQFIDGQTILAELEMLEPISPEELNALKTAGNGQAHFKCSEAVLYRANQVHVAGAKDCVADQLATGAPR